MADSTNDIQFTPDEEEALARMSSGMMPFMEERGLKPYIYMNDRSNPAPPFVLDMFYRNTFANGIGIMVAKNTETGEEDTLLVGVEIDEDGNEGAFPIAKLLGPEAYDIYAVPNGKGYEYDEATNEA